LVDIVAIVCDNRQREQTCNNSYCIMHVKQLTDCSVLHKTKRKNIRINPTWTRNLIKVQVRDGIPQKCSEKYSLAVTYLQIVYCTWTDAVPSPL